MSIVFDFWEQANLLLLRASTCKYVLIDLAYHILATISFLDLYKTNQPNLIFQFLQWRNKQAVACKPVSYRYAIKVVSEVDMHLSLAWMPW